MLLAKVRFAESGATALSRERKFVVRKTCPSMSDWCQGPLTATHLPLTWRRPTDWNGRLQA